MNEFVPQRTAAYISQHDVHLAELTVRETLSFSARFQGVGYAREMLADLCRREKEANIKPDPDIDLFMKASAVEGQEENIITDYILKILGLDICADTMVGDEVIRGVSGGQRKRVTTGEMLVGPTKALFMDEISTGLDSSTTYQIVNSVRQSVHILNGTAIISLLQPAPETYDLFDDIILLSDGQIVYQGPREHVLDFFKSMGFQCPDRKGVADFLQEVTSKKDQEQYWERRHVPYHFITSMEFAEAFKSFHVGRKLHQELAVAFDRTKSHPAALTTEKYGVSTRDYLKACFDRELLLMKRDSFVYIFKLTQLTILSCIIMTVFFRTKMHKDTIADGSLFSGALFFGVVLCMFHGMSEISMTVGRLPVFYKQRDLLFFPSWAYSLPGWILKIPISFVEVTVLVFLTYYVIGFDSNVGRMFKYYLILVLANQMASGLFKTIASLGRTMVVSNTFGSCALLGLFVLGGFILSKDNVKKWWIWGYWASPMMYAQNAVVVNEFLGHSWRKILPSQNETLGVVILKSRGFPTQAYWYWIAVGALVGFTLLFNIVYTLALALLSPFKTPQAIPDDNDDKMNNTSGNGGEIIVKVEQEIKKRGMILPFEQHLITFDEVRYSVDMPQGSTYQQDQWILFLLAEKH